MNAPASLRTCRHERNIHPDGCECARGLFMPERPFFRKFSSRRKRSLPRKIRTENQARGNPSGCPAMSALQDFHDPVIIFRQMGESTVRADFYLSPVFFQISRISRAVFPRVHRAVTKQTVEMLHSPMTREIPARPVFKITMRIFHYALASNPFRYFFAFSTNALAKAGFDG